MLSNETYNLQGLINAGKMAGACDFLKSRTGNEPGTPSHQIGRRCAILKFNLHSVWDNCIIEKKIGLDYAGIASKLCAEITDEDRSRWVPLIIGTAAVVAWRTSLQPLPIGRMFPWCALQMNKNHHHGSVAEPRAPLLQAVLRFVLDARICRGVLRIALVGSLTTAKPLPKDADVLVTIEDGLDLGPLAKAARRLKGTAQQMNLGADIFLADAQGRYLGRICHYRECHPRVACRAQHCGRQAHLNDDFQVVTLAQALIASPPVELWPGIRRRVLVSGDVEELLLGALASDG